MHKLGEFRDAAELVDDLVGEPFHACACAIIASYRQASYCVNRDSHDGLFDENGYVDVDQLKHLMRENRDTQSGLARMLGITPDKFNKVLKGKRRFTVEEANKLTTYYGTGGNQDQAPVLLPIVGLVSAGTWRQGFEQTRGYMPSPDKTLSKDAFVVIVEGDSMDLVAQPGEGIIIEPRDLDLLPGRYYIIRNESGESTFKRYMEQPARLEPCSSNPEHKTIYPGREEFTIIGRAKKRVSDL